MCYLSEGCKQPLISDNLLHTYKKMSLEGQEPHIIIQHHE